MFRWGVVVDVCWISIPIRIRSSGFSEVFRTFSKLSRIRGRRKDFFQEEAVVDFSKMWLKGFFHGDQHWWNLFLTTQSQAKNIFYTITLIRKYHNSKFKWIKSSLPPFRGPCMHQFLRREFVLNILHLSCLMPANAKVIFYSLWKTSSRLCWFDYGEYTLYLQSWLKRYVSKLTSNDPECSGYCF